MHSPARCPVLSLISRNCVQGLASTSGDGGAKGLSQDGAGGAVDQPPMDIIDHEEGNEEETLLEGSTKVAPSDVPSSQELDPATSNSTAAAASTANFGLGNFNICFREAGLCID